MIALAVGVLGSKPVCRLRAKECRRLAELAVKAFIGSRGIGDDGQVGWYYCIIIVEQHKKQNCFVCFF